MSSTTDRTWRDTLAWVNCPLLLVGFMATAVYCLHRGFEPTFWVPALAAAHFFVLVTLERVIPRNPSYDLFRDRQSVNDLVFNTLNGLTRPSVGAAVAVFVAWLADGGHLGALTNSWPIHAPLAVQVAAGVLCVSFMDYWNHRFGHTVDRLWWFHSLHHSATQMHVLKGGRIHLVDEILHDVVTALPFVLLGAPAAVILLAGMWSVFTGNMVHANVDQRFASWVHYLLPTVQLHNLHHSDQRQLQDTNYSGILPAWDLLFGTFSHPDRFALGALGIRERYVSDDLLKQFYLPLLWQWRRPL